MEVFDGGGGVAARLGSPPTARQAAKQMSGRVALPAFSLNDREDRTGSDPYPMGPMGNITVDQLPDRIGVGFQIVFERGGRLFDACEDF